MTLASNVDLALDADAALALRLAAIVGDAHVVTDEAERAYLSRDFFYWEGAGTAALAVAPGTVEDVQAVIRELAGLGREVSIRGGGMSTGRSYVPRTNSGVMIDMRRLNRIREINVVDRYIVVEAGCTWRQVVDALDSHGLRCDFTIPLSGSVSTVGGAMAHAVTGGMKGILGVEVVRANGDLIRTGSWAREASPTPYWRDYGPDLTGLFLGDTGAFGVKTAVSLHLSRKPEASAFASFTFSTMPELTEVMVELSAFDFITLRSGFDPRLTRNAMDVNLVDGAKTLGQIVKADSSLVGGVTKALKIAVAGQGAMKDAEWSLHLRVDQLTQAAANEGMDRARALCLKRGGREIAPSIAIAIGAGPLTVRGTLNRDGDRWIATNSVFPLSRAVEACAVLQDFLEARRDEFADHDVKVGCFTTCSAVHFQIEPLFWWSDKVSELALRHIDPKEAERFRAIPENPRNREFITRTRFELRDLFQELGAIHVHTSKFFRYAELLIPGAQALVRDLKTALDPEGMLNPGNLGL
jgi:D-lactate dehydrogenase (cytochrome)